VRGTGNARSLFPAAGAIEQGRKDSLSYKKGHEAARPAAEQPTNPD